MAEVDTPAVGGVFAGATTDRGRTPGGRFNGDGISGFVAQVLEASILWIGDNPPSSEQYILWINTEDGRWYGKWYDGDSTQWVDLSLPFGEGLPGPRGPQGERGLTGQVGEGLPAGGLANEILVKVDGTDYNAAWGARPADGLNVLNGAGVPSDVSDGVDGEFYIDTSAWDIYGPKTAGAWGSGTSLIGPTGATGATGATGPAGPGLPTGGTAGQIIEKVDGTDYNTAWVDAPLQSFVIACSDESTALTTGTGKVTFRMPYAFTVTEVRANVKTAPTGAALQVDINESGVSILSTVLSIDATEKTSETAAVAAVISDSSLADDAEITIDIDQVGSTIAGAGLKVAIIGRPT